MGRPRLCWRGRDGVEGACARRLVPRAWRGLVGPGGAWRGLVGHGGAWRGLVGPGGAWRGLATKTGLLQAAVAIPTTGR